MFTASEIKELKKKGISTENAEEQLKIFRTGFPYQKIIAPAAIDKGILKPTPDTEKNWIKLYEEKRVELDIVKFVPASGAASRMFKSLFELLQTSDEKIPELLQTHSDLFQIFDHLESFAFFPALLQKIKQHGDMGILKEKLRNTKKIAGYILQEFGLNYGNKPKGLILFHTYIEGDRTPVEEHLLEGTLYACGKSSVSRLHFTVSPEHLDWFKTLVQQWIPVYEKKFKVKLEVSFSFQDPANDTLAVDMENRPFKMGDGKLLFRPGGHGALLENLNDIDADLVFIKNIDNVVPDRLKATTVKFKKLLAGALLYYRDRIFKYLNLLERENVPSRKLLDKIHVFLENNLFVRKGNLTFSGVSDEKDYLFRKLNRPIRVCGMVKNQGEPGGGPFLTVQPDHIVSPQILETSQLDLTKKENQEFLKKATHFNPVDLVCSYRDYRGKKFNLPDFRDDNTGFISVKSKDGKNLKALELPGLWNGAMADWNTIFVEVPIETFNPVKTINDLLRPEHQS